MKFSDLGLQIELLKAVEKRGYVQTTSIQQQAIPIALQGRDILGCAQTGTGKTAAFALPILQRLFVPMVANSLNGQSNASGRGTAESGSEIRKSRAIRALILVPTRELAVQVAESFGTYGKFLGLKLAAIFGGVNARPQIQNLRRGVDIVIATPGRLLDLASQGFVKFDRVEAFVLDEADQMFDMGFIRDVRRIIRQLPRQRQTMLFSATLPSEILSLASDCLTNPVSISATPAAVTPVKIEQQVCYVQADQKTDVLIDFLREQCEQKTLVFCRTKHGADKVVKRLRASGIAAVVIHGNKSQNARQAALRLFNAPRPPVLVATDVAARGLHIPGIKIVVNYELSDTPDTYVHRIGRTARAEEVGRAVTFCAPSERALMQRIQNLTKVCLSVIPTPTTTRQVNLEPPRTTSAPSRTEQVGQRQNGKPGWGTRPTRKFSRFGRKPWLAGNGRRSVSRRASGFSPSGQ